MAEFCRKCNGRIAIDVDCPHTAGDRVAAVVDRNGSVQPPETVVRDIVERLRDRAGTWLDHCYDDAELDRKAADEIERLRDLIVRAYRADQELQPYPPEATTSTMFADVWAEFGAEAVKCGYVESERVREYWVGK